MGKLFQNGNPGKPKGAVNKVSQKVREAVVKFLEDNIDQVTEDYKELSLEKRIDFIERLLPYAIPKHAAIQVEHSGEIQENIKVSWEMPKTIEDALQGSPHNGSVGNENGH